MSIEERIESWLREHLEEEKPVEIISFFNELPIKSKVKVVSLGKNYVQLETNPKLNLAVKEFGRVYTYFNDPLYNERRVLGADVIYYNKGFIETTKFKLFEEPRLRRKTPRVLVSNKYPVKATILKDKTKESAVVKDVSENGIGLFVASGDYLRNQKLQLEIELPYGCFPVEGEVRFVNPEKDGKRIGIQFLKVPAEGKRWLIRYIMDRQRETLEKLRMLAEE